MSNSAGEKLVDYLHNDCTICLHNNILHDEFMNDCLLPIYITTNTTMANMDRESYRYSREDLLKLQHTKQRDCIYNWSHIDSIVNTARHRPQNTKIVEYELL